MELWIRSQDKKLLMKSTELIYNQKKEDYSILAYDTKGDYRLLGIYKSKERALEVLDEIQNILKPKMIVNTYKVEQAKLCDGTQFIQPMLDDIQVQNATTYVYEMPND